MARLRFYARGTALVTDVAAQERGIRRFIGRRFQEVLPGRWAWVPTGEPQAVEYSGDLAKACRDGDLWAADEETARACRVPFDPKYGGELTETIKAFKEKKAAEEAAKKSFVVSEGVIAEKNKPEEKAGGKGER